MSTLRARTSGLVLPVAVMLPLLLPTLLGLAGRNCRRLRQAKDDGASLAELVIITAVIAVAAIAVGAILVGKFTDKANDLDLTTP